MADGAAAVVPLSSRASAQVGFSIADQILSSVTNLLVVVLLARSSTTAKFGRFSIILSVFVIVLGISRALTTEPMAAKYGRLDERKGHDPTRAVIQTSCLVGSLAPRATT